MGAGTTVVFRQGPYLGPNCDTALVELSMSPPELVTTGWMVVIGRGVLVKYSASIRKPE
jgi:hypothetical protein